MISTEISLVDAREYDYMEISRTRAEESCDATAQPEALRVVTVYEIEAEVGGGRELGERFPRRVRSKYIECEVGNVFEDVMV